MNRNKEKTGFALACVLASLWLTFSAQAGTIDFEPVVGTISGQNTLVFEFDVVEAGAYRITLTDMADPAPFQLLGIGLVDPDGLFLDDVVGTGVLNLDFTVDPGSYLALVGGLADADTNIGTFGLEISNVPIPGVGILMVSALSTFGFLSRSRGSAKGDPVS